MGNLPCTIAVSSRPNPSPKAIPTRSPIQISDAVLDAILAEDPAARVACETLVTTGLAVIAGEITTNAYVHLPDIVRDDDRAHRLHRRRLSASTARPARS